MHSLCTLHLSRRRLTCNTHYRAGATPYPDGTFTRWNTPAFPGAPFLRPSLHRDSAPQGVAVKTGRRPTPEATRSGLDGRVQRLIGASVLHQRRIVGNDFANPNGERPIAGTRYDKPKGLEQAKNVVRNCLELREEMSTRHQQHSQCLGVHALDGDLAKPAGSHDLASPCASLAAVLLSCVLRAPLACRASGQTTGRPCLRS